MGLIGLAIVMAVRSDTNWRLPQTSSLLVFFSIQLTTKLVTLSHRSVGLGQLQVFAFLKDPQFTETAKCLSLHEFDVWQVWPPPLPVAQGDLRSRLRPGSAEHPAAASQCTRKASIITIIMSSNIQTVEPHIGNCCCFFASSLNLESKSCLTYLHPAGTPKDKGST